MIKRLKGGVRSSRILKTGEPIHQEEQVPIRILTNDPSMTAWGWAIIDEYGHVVDSGAIKTIPTDKKLRVRKGDDNTRRITDITGVLLQIISVYRPAVIISELPHGSQSAVAALMLGFATAILQTMANTLNIPLEWYSEGDAKLAVCGKRSIEKNAMVALMHEKNPTMTVRKIKWVDQAVADSLAVYYAALNQSSLLKLLVKQK